MFHPCAQIFDEGSVGSVQPPGAFNRPGGFRKTTPDALPVLGRVSRLPGAVAVKITTSDASGGRLRQPLCSVLRPLSCVCTHGRLVTRRRGSYPSVGLEDLKLKVMSSSCYFRLPEARFVPQGRQKSILAKIWLRWTPGWVWVSMLSHAPGEHWAHGGHKSPSPFTGAPIRALTCPLAHVDQD